MENLQPLAQPLDRVVLGPELHDGTEAAQRIISRSPCRRISRSVRTSTTPLRSRLGSASSSSLGAEGSAARTRPCVRPRSQFFNRRVQPQNSLGRLRPGPARRADQLHRLGTTLRRVLRWTLHHGIPTSGDQPEAGVHLADQAHRRVVGVVPLSPAPYPGCRHGLPANGPELAAAD